jgi:hypothetical protein
LHLFDGVNRHLLFLSAHIVYGDTGVEWNTRRKWTPVATMLFQGRTSGF